MGGIRFGFFALSAVLFLGAIHYLLASQRPGSYPPKHVLRARATALAGGGLVLFAFAMLLLLF
ncbi:hypothetical protein CVD25_11975 [Bacillus canaveralius]|uniref:Uncharacterized protein n=1 Tax=Bacillus canaveralius TaxID=1403243 RepID=A0A2N5GNH2_9BACI|nr:MULTISPECIES: hypothetical protein [Bacillus]PLR83751.1 hypothetical protein CU635_08395 [Bacillus canaveralius]PLR86681.1 hypothetical protein CVD23_05975 [Bacillus sp. V33-4]PLR96437.1 hypothetical protein CVD25_11975 [Bacillus canaveralius]RSK43764.1 hypothetical protein EJA13_21085 [Bacillus canaveralius]